MAAPIDPETLRTWTTGALVLHIARYAASPAKEQNAPVRKLNAELMAAELNARVPPRVLPARSPKAASSAGASVAPDPVGEMACTMCTVCRDTGRTSTGEDTSWPCDCAAGDTAIFTGPYGTETGAALKARARRDGT